MVVSSSHGPRLEQDLLHDAERLRGGALSCACCGGSGDDGGGSSRPSHDLEGAQGNQASVTPQAAPQTPQGGPQMSQPTPASSSPPIVATDKGGSTTRSPSSLAPPAGESDRKRARSFNPPPVSANPPPGPAQTRARHATSPSLQTTQHAPLLSPRSVPVVEGSGNLGRGYNPVIPSSVSTVGKLKASGQPPVPAPFVRDRG